MDIDSIVKNLKISPQSERRAKRLLREFMINTSKDKGYRPVFLAEDSEDPDRERIISYFKNRGGTQLKILDQWPREIIICEVESQIFAIREYENDEFILLRLKN